MPVRSMTLTTLLISRRIGEYVSDACQINDFDHGSRVLTKTSLVSDACQINDFDHVAFSTAAVLCVSDACQINDFDHC